MFFLLQTITFLTSVLEMVNFILVQQIQVTKIIKWEEVGEVDIFAKIDIMVKIDILVNIDILVKIDILIKFVFLS